MIVLRPASIVILLVALLSVAVACGSDDPPDGSRGPETGPGPAGEPTATAISKPSVPQPAATRTASPFDDIKSHPLTLLAGRLPSRPGVEPTAAPGRNFEFERKIDSFPADGPRPYIELVWNAPIPVANDDQQGFIKLLGRIPDTAENRSQLNLSDVELFRNLIGFEPVSFEDGANAFLDQVIEVISTEMDRSDRSSQVPWPGGGAFLSGFTDYMSNVDTFGPLGFDGRNTDQTAIAAANGPDFTEVVVGRYSPELSKQLLAQCECPQPDTVTEYGGFEYWSWGDGPRGELKRRLAAPVFDHVGRGGHVLMTEDGLYRTLEVSLMERLIDTLNGNAASLKQSPDHLFIADVMAAYSANGVQVTNGERLARTEILPDSEGVYSRISGPDTIGYSESFESNRANALLAPLMLPFEMIATGTGWDGTRQTEVVILIHADEQTAIENAGRLADRLVNSNGPDGLPWATKYPSVDISVSGNRLVTVFRDSLRPHYILGNTYGQILFAHEADQ